jgi:chromate transport protein ChrA
VAGNAPVPACRSLPGLDGFRWGQRACGPVALVGYMRCDIVEDRQWYTDAEYEQGLAIAQTMLCPLAAQLAIWLGYLERGALGALAVTIPFVLPPLRS